MGITKWLSTRNQYTTKLSLKQINITHNKLTMERYKLAALVYKENKLVILECNEMRHDE